MFRQAGVIQVDTLEEMFDVAQLRRPPAAAARAPGRDRRQLRRARPARRRRRRFGGAGGHPLGRAGRRSHRSDDFEDALDAAIDDPEVDSVVAVYIPPLDVSGEEVADVLAAVGEQSDKPLVSSFLGAEGVPELLRVPDVAGSTAGRGSVPSYPAVEAAVRALARVVDYAVWLRTPDGADGRARRGRPGRGQGPGPPAADRQPRRHRPRPDDARPRCWPPTASTSGRPAGSRRWPRRPRPGRDAGLGRRAQGHHRPAPRAPRPGPRVAQHRPPGRDARRLAVPGRADRRLGRPPGSWCRRTPRPAYRSPSAASRTRCSARWSPSASPGRSSSCSRTGPTGSRRSASATPRAMIREIKASPMLFGYRGSRGRSTSRRSRTCSQRVAQLQNDLPQVCVAGALAGAGRRRPLLRAHRARARVDPVSDPRSDWFVRRLPGRGRRHHPGLSGP